MKINCVWEHNGNDTLLYALGFAGAYTRGEELKIAKQKMPAEIASYIKWSEARDIEISEIVISEEKISELEIRDADSDVIFNNEKIPLTADQYKKLKTLALKSAEDFIILYNSIADKDAVFAQKRKTFYGWTPCSANEMYEHTKNVNEYYFAEIGVAADNNGDIYDCRKRGFELSEKRSDYLANHVSQGSYGEIWSLSKVMRRFIWHDRIHAKAMYRMATNLFGIGNVADPFCFGMLR